MPTALEKCQHHAKHFSLQESALLIKVLIDDFDEKDLELLRIKEASRRFQEFKAGNIKSRLGADVFYDAQIKLHTGNCDCNKKRFFSETKSLNQNNFCFTFFFPQIIFCCSIFKNPNVIL
jgi:hypothetical protein